MIPPYLSDSTLWWGLVPIPALTILVALVFYATLVGANRKAGAWLVVFPFTAFLLLGLVAGYLTGLSRESAVGAVVPAVLTLMGGVAAVLIGRAANQAATLRVSGLIVSFSIGLLVGTTWGSAMRQAVTDFEASEKELIRRSLVELKVREFREALGLPAEFPQNGDDASGKKKKAPEKDK
ncbi:MAG: hypothetical protein M3Y55_00355 [Pseudomonadota bacterium]|nr:hypothetical protein [Pseudomonadota bacterium]